LGKVFRNTAASIAFLVIFFCLNAASPAQAATTALTISTTTLPHGAVGQAYSTTLKAAGGTAPYSWKVTAGTHPPGLGLTADTGLIYGKPTEAGTFNITIAVTDSSKPAQTKSATVSIVVAAATTSTLSITSTSLPSGTVGASYSKSLTATGGTAPYSWSVTGGTHPPGLSLVASTGLIYGKPTEAGTFNITVAVKDSSKTAQTKSASVSIVIAAATTSTLSITSTSLPSGAVGTSYSKALTATGGTTPYAWSISAGSLPAGLTLAASTGVISGKPTATGAFKITATVKDSASHTASDSLALTVAATTQALTITTGTLAAAVDGTEYSAPMTATGGTPAYTWSITAGKLPAGLTLAATTGIISGKPTATGTSSFTATVTDNSSPAQTKSAAASIVVGAEAPAASGPGITWYIRSDGGTRYSSRATTGQCDGKADVAYPGTGTNQHCAFKDYRYLWDDQSYGNDAWVIAGGDTVIIRNGPWRVGYDSGSGTSNTWCYGGSGPYDCFNPPIPAGTANQHTRILGANYASCGSKTSMTQIYGGYGVDMALNLDGAQYVDVECIELTRHSQCTESGSPASPAGCNKTAPMDDYSNSGIFENTSTHDVLLQDMWIHGFPSRGIIGPIGGTMTATRVDIAYNGMAGWDFDDGSATKLVNAVWNFNYSTIEFSGCNQEYPIVHTYPAISCYSQSTGGYGDGVGTPTGTGLTTNIDHSLFRYNTQDGLDVGHVDTGGPYTLNITNSTFYGNSGGAFKWGPNFTKVTVENNLALANCNRMAAALSGAPSTYNAHLEDFCRAGDAISFNFRQGGSVLIAGNTIATYASTVFDTQCWDAAGEGSVGDSGKGCGSSSLTVKDNIILAYSNPNNDYGNDGGPGMYYYRDPIGTVVRNNNLYYGLGHDFTCLTSELCTSPLLVNQPVFSGESSLDNFNFDISSGSPARGAGTAVPGLTLDFTGATRANPPSIGAYEK
jgi:hypothetical protein